MTDSAAAGWRTLARQAAVAQAEAEARRVWQVGPGEPIPFNHRWEHVREVVALALWLATASGADREIVEAAAWLHDVRKEEPSHGVAGAVAAQALLAGSDFPAAKLPAVAEAIRRHVGLYRADGAPPITPLEAAVLWDADKLSKLGVQALVFNLSTVYAVQQTLDQRRMDNLTFAEDVLSRTVTSMNTPPARALAERRYREMLAVLEWWAQDAHEGEHDFEVSSDHAGLSQE
jgi:uncharacterized protein